MAYAWGLKAAVRNAMLPCPKCKASPQSPCMTWWNILVPLGLVSHAERALPSDDEAKEAK